MTSSTRQSPTDQAPAERPPPLRLYLIRHGETAWSLSGRHMGRTDMDLSIPGRQQAQALATWLHNVRFDHVRASPLQRARQTCRLAGLAPTEQVEPDLAEWDYGDYEGLYTADVRRHRPHWVLQQDGCPGGESPAQVAERTDRLLARLRTLQGNVALFSHAQFGAALAMRWIGLPVLQARHFTLLPASVSVLGLDARHAGVPVIALWNAVAPERPESPFSTGPADPAARRRALERWENEGGEVPPPSTA